MRRRIDSGFGRCLANVSCERIRRGTGFCRRRRAWFGMTASGMPKKYAKPPCTGASLPTA